MSWRAFFRTALAAGAIALASAPVISAEFDDGQIDKTRDSLKGKRVGFVPISMGFDLPQVWYEGLRRDAERYGYQIVVRDANWNVQSGAQAINELIGEKVDLLIIHPLEFQAYAKLVDKANAAGIPVVQINLKSFNTGDAYVGANWNSIFIQTGQEMLKRCGKEAGGDGKVAFVQGVLTTPGSQIGRQALDDFFKQHPDLTIVADQAADWDATKAKSVASTILKQHPDLCGFIGFWEVQDMGIAAAIKEAGLQGKVTLVTSGGGEQKSACDNVANGNFTVDVSYDARSQARDLATVVTTLLQEKPTTPGSHPIGVYSQNKVITAENANSGVCWSLDEVKKYGP
jgi:ribose transport system substrate-binding protein